MKFLFLFIVIIIILYINNDCYKHNEKFKETTQNDVLDTTQYDILDTTKVKPMSTNDRTLKIIQEPERELYGLEYDNQINNNYSDKYWQIKKNDFSDIYNNEDDGSIEIRKRVNDPKYKNLEYFSNVKPTFLYENENYHIIGAAINHYYNQYFYLYESQVITNKTDVLKDNLNYIDYKIFKYLLVKIHNNELVVVHYIGPRNKININDIVYLSLGSFQLGPLEIKQLEY